MEDKLERLIDHIIHTTLFVDNIGTDKHPDYKVGGIDFLKKEILELIDYKFSKESCKDGLHSIDKNGICFICGEKINFDESSK